MKSVKEMPGIEYLLNHNIGNYGTKCYHKNFNLNEIIYWHTRLSIGGKKENLRSWFDKGIDTKIVKALNNISLKKQDFFLGGITPKEFEEIEPQLKILKEEYKRTKKYWEKVSIEKRKGDTTEKLLWIIAFLDDDLGLFHFPHYQTIQDTNIVAKKGTYFGAHNVVTNFVIEEIMKINGLFLDAAFCLPYKKNRLEDMGGEIYEINTVWCPSKGDKEVNIGIINAENLLAKIKKIKNKYGKEIKEWDLRVKYYREQSYFKSITGCTSKDTFIVRSCSERNGEERSSWEGTELIISSPNERYIDAFFKNIKTLVHSENRKKRRG